MKVRRTAILKIKYICQIQDDCGKVVGKVEKSLKICGKLRGISEIRVEKPILWDLDHPYLYTYKIILEEDGEILDTVEDIFGVRTGTGMM